MAARPVAVGVAATVAALLAGASAALTVVVRSNETLVAVAAWTFFALALLLALAAIGLSRLGRRSRAALAWGVGTLALLAAYVAWGVWTLCGWGC